MLVISISSGREIDRVTQAYIDSQDSLHLLHRDYFFVVPNSWGLIVMGKCRIGLTYDVLKERVCGNKQVTTPTSNRGTESGRRGFYEKLRCFLCVVE